MGHLRGKLKIKDMNISIKKCDFWDISAKNRKSVKNGVHSIKIDRLNIPNRITRFPKLHRVT